MNNYIKLEFKRSIFSQKSLIVFLLTLLLFAINFYIFTNVPGFNLAEFKQRYDAIDILILLRRNSLVFIGPILASFIFSDSYLLDIETGFIKFLFLRISKKKYIRTKLLVNAISGAIPITFATIIVSIILSVFIGIHPDRINTISGPFSAIYYNSKFLYLILLIIVTFLFYCIFATLSLGISTWINNRYLTVISSFFYQLISGTLFVYMGLYKVNTTMIFLLNTNLSEFELILYSLLLLICGLLLFFIGVNKNCEKII